MSPQSTRTLLLVFATYVSHTKWGQLQWNCRPTKQSKEVLSVTGEGRSV